MEMQEVKSSNISAIGYDASTQTLRVEFKNGSVFDYAGVEPEKFEALQDAGSVGSYFHAHIRGQYQAERVEV